MQMRGPKQMLFIKKNSFRIFCYSSEKKELRNTQNLQNNRGGREREWTFIRLMESLMFDKDDSHTAVTAIHSAKTAFHSFFSHDKQQCEYFKVQICLCLFSLSLSSIIKCYCDIHGEVKGMCLHTQYAKIKGHKKI